MRLLRDDLERRIVRLAIPALGTLAIEPVYVLVDTAIVGRIGTAELAGLAIAATVLFNVFALVGFLEYVTPDVAFAHSSGNPTQARQVATTSMWLAAILGAPAGLVVAALARPICHLIGGRGAVLEAAVTYLRISAIGIPFVLVTLVGHGVMRGVNDLRKPLVIVLVANVVNLVAEIITVYGFGWGIAGSAWTTVFVQIAAAFWFAGILRPHLARLGPMWSRIRPMLGSGAYLTLRALAMYAVWNAATVIAARIDTPTLAAHQVLTQLFIFLALVLDALAIPSHSIVAGALGEGNVDEAMRIGTISTRLSLWGGGVLAVVLAALSPVIPYLFTDDPAVRSRLTVGLLILAVMQLPGAIAFALDGALIGAHDEKFLGRAAILNIAGFVPVAAAVVVWPWLGLAGVWASHLTWMITRALVNQRRWTSRRWVSNLDATSPRERSVAT